MATRHHVRGSDVPGEPADPGERHIVETTAVGAPAPAVESRVVRSGWSRYSPSQFVHGACGIFLVVVGGVTVGRAGFSDGITSHTVDVLGIRTTALLGLVELFAGLLLLCAALAPEAKAFGGFIGVLLFVGGIVVAAGSNQMLDDMHTESALGWVGIVIGAVAMLGALLPAFLIGRRSSSVDVW